MKTFLQIALPVGVVGLGVGVAAVMILTRPPIEPREPVVLDPLVRVLVVQPTNVTVSVSSQGTVQPRSAIRLVSEVSGVIVNAAEALAAGGYFAKDEVLIEIDPRDYELALIQAEARVREAEARLLREEAEAQVARDEWADLGQTGEPSPLLLREPQLAEARAQLASARANVELARRDLEKTRIRAPFAGRVLNKEVDIGQYVAPGTQLAQVYSVDAAEVHLPITSGEVGYLHLPFSFRGEERAQPAPEVVLGTSFGGEHHEWHGRIVRTAGEIDPRTRMVTVVAEVEDPYGRKHEHERPPLAAGMFVRAEIKGRTFDNIFQVPRFAVRGDSLLVVDDENRLWKRPVEVLRASRDNVLVKSGLKSGDRVCLTPLETPVEGMKVRVAQETDATTAPEPQGQGGRS